MSNWCWTLIALLAYSGFRLGRTCRTCTLAYHRRLRNRFSEDKAWQTFIYHPRYLQAPKFQKIYNSLKKVFEQLFRLDRVTVFMFYRVRFSFALNLSDNLSRKLDLKYSFAISYQSLRSFCRIMENIKRTLTFDFIITRVWIAFLMILTNKFWIIHFSGTIRQHKTNEEPSGNYFIRVLIVVCG